VKGVNKRFGGLQALSDVGLEIQRGQIYGLIGPNGAGKTTFFNVITGLYRRTRGSFVPRRRALRATAVHMVARAGIARTFQNIRLFGEMTALENVMVGRHVRTRSGVWGAVFKTRASATRRRASGAGPSNCSSTWASCSTPTSRPARCPMATSAGWRSRARSRRTRSCWRSTNRPPA